ncbi:uncharacterized protein LOC106070007 isoform X1 [Biomphalaria glabrata]|uniref:Uncharacterized protein LOC106070007 isoform X1 n=2 Tax=Biomphalaria glabrata TaxID=6526 RepID=A0A9W2Z4L9_BIOGL|nr:uncharacterized protein LOC106070007 isoform X1 [Biomphalaria glabrata]XP_055869863.1 uncharacterized protein LOC106070007 isoform X1 [Biomphalaria glabrata]XP_055869864.1 uncharacterized protein LOC106070007 isoform X1 [Biomphalaria glabrata]
MSGPCNSKRLIQSHYVLLKENLNAEKMADFCFQSEVITMDQKEEIMAKSCQSARNGKLLDTILRQSSCDLTSSDIFIKALKQYHPEVWTKLPTEPQTYADVLKRCDNPQGVARNSPATYQENHSTMTNVKSLIENLSHLTTTQQPKDKIFKCLNILNETLKSELDFSSLTEEFLKTSNLHNLLLQICKLEESFCTKKVDLQLLALALKITLRLVETNTFFSQTLCSEHHLSTWVHILIKSRMPQQSSSQGTQTRSRSQLFGIQSSCLNILSNILACQICNAAIFDNMDISKILKPYVASENEEHRVPSTLILIFLHKSSELLPHITETVNTLVDWLKKVLEQTEEKRAISPNAACTLRGLVQLASVETFQEKIKESQYIKSLVGSDCWDCHPLDARLYLKLLASPNFISFNSTGESNCRSMTTTIQDSDTNLLIIGIKGCGKSSLGNSILGRCAFQINCDKEEMKETIAVEKGTFNGRVLAVVDTPSVTETLSIQKQCQTLSDAFNSNKNGYHAILLVLQYGFRFESQDLIAIEDFKRIFGEHFLKDYGILVFTFGDYFEQDVLYNEQTFEQWLREQSNLSDLIRDCKNRIILFNNMTHDETKMSQQRIQLFQYIDKIRLADSTFSKEHFLRAEKTRDKLIQDETKRTIFKSVSEEVNLLEQDLHSVTLKAKIEDQQCQLQMLRETATTLQERINQEQINNTFNYSHLYHKVQHVISEIENQKKLLKGITSNRRKLSKKCSRHYNK